MRARLNLQIANGHAARSNKWFLFVDDLVNTDVRVEVGLDVLEDRYGAIGTPTAAPKLLAL